MNAQVIKLYGYWLSLLPMTLFVIGVLIGMPWLVAVFFFAIMPIVRLFVMDDPAEAADTELISATQFEFLKAIPWVQVAVWSMVLPWSMFVLSDTSAFELPGFMLGLWTVMSLNLPVVHEMLHSRDRSDRIAARFFAGSIGYFQMLEEHKSHHTTTGVVDGDSAAVGESLYEYAIKRYFRSFAVAWEWEKLKQARRDRSCINNRIVVTALFTVAVLSGFWVTSGWKGVAVYVVLMIGTSFSFQAITYIQHWGLTQNTAPALSNVGYSWDDRCWLQACVTLNVAYHGHHHKRPGLPYFQLSAFGRAPRLPASYPVMFLLALVPPVFNKIMIKRLQSWLADHDVGSSPRTRSCMSVDELLRV